MGIYGYYIRATRDELDRAQTDQSWARQMISERMLGWFDHEGADQSVVLSVDKAWNGVFHVLEASGMPEELIYGAELIPNVEGQPPQPHYLHPGQVEEAAAWLAQRPFVDLVESVDPDAARAASPYSVGEWNDDDRSFVADWASDLPAFFAAAAKNGDAVVIKISF